jgi:hypothetical protein
MGWEACANLAKFLRPMGQPVPVGSFHNRYVAEFFALARSHSWNFAGERFAVRCSMNVRHAIVALSALIVAPLVFGLGVFLLIPVALVLLPVVAIAGIAALPAVFAAMSRGGEHGVAAAPASARAAITA